MSASVDATEPTPAAAPPLCRVPAGERRIPAWWWVAGGGAVLAAWWALLGATDAALLPTDTAARARRFVAELSGAGSAATPAYLQAASWAEVLGLAGETLLMSVLATAAAGVGALATLAFASRDLTLGAGAPRPVAVAVLAVTRGVHAVARAVPDFVWALLALLVLKPGVIAGAVALGIHNFGVMGRLGSDVVDDLEPGPLRALRSAGAGRFQVLSYGVVPQVLPQFLTFLCYRWEIAIRASAVVGLVAGAGVGYALRLHLSAFRMTDVALVLVVYVLLVLGVDLASASLRRLAR